MQLFRMTSGDVSRWGWGGSRAFHYECVITTCKDHKVDRRASPTQPLLLSPGETRKICLSGNKPIAVLLAHPPRRPARRCNGSCKQRGPLGLWRVRGQTVNSCYWITPATHRVQPTPGAAVTVAGRSRNDGNLFAARNYLFPVQRNELSICSARLIVAGSAWTASDDRVEQPFVRSVVLRQQKQPFRRLCYHVLYRCLTLAPL